MYINITLNGKALKPIKITTDEMQALDNAIKNGIMFVLIGGVNYNLTKIDKFHISDGTHAFPPPPPPPFSYGRD